MIAKCPVCNTDCEIRRSEVLRTFDYHFIEHNAADNQCHGSGKLVDRNDIRAQRSATLPEWVSKAISYIAYDRGHPAGAVEIAMIEEDMICTFEDYMRNHEKK